MRRAPVGGPPGCFAVAGGGIWVSVIAILSHGEATGAVEA